MHIQAKNNDFSIDFAIFTKALPTDRPTDRRTNGPTDRRTDIPSYRDAIAASKNWKNSLHSLVSEAILSDSDRVLTSLSILLPYAAARNNVITLSVRKCNNSERSQK